MAELLARVRVDRDDAVREEVVPLPNAAVEVRARIARVEVQAVELRVKRGRGPAVGAAPRPRLALGRPGVATGLVGLGIM